MLPMLRTKFLNSQLVNPVYRRFTEPYIKNDPSDDGDPLNGTPAGIRTPNV